MSQNMTVGDRIKELRLLNKMTQSELAERVGLTYVQIGRYEKQKSNPSADVLQRLAEALNTSADFLMNGDSQDIVAGKITDRELVSLFQAVEQLNNDDQQMIKTFLDAIITKRKVQSLAS